MQRNASDGFIVAEIEPLHLIRRGLLTEEASGIAGLSRRQKVMTSGLVTELERPVRGRVNPSRRRGGRCIGADNPDFTRSGNNAAHWSKRDNRVGNRLFRHAIKDNAADLSRRILNSRADYTIPSRTGANN